MELIEQIEQLDQNLFLILNKYHNPFLDQIMWHISGKLEWIPLYLLLIFFVFRNYGRRSWIILLSVAVLITLGDQVSVNLFKEVFERYRPCHNLEIGEMVHLVDDKCGGKYSFVSSHATNTFALATFVGLIFSRASLLIMLLWASLVSYSRIYLGVHYPLDVVGGALLGMFLGIIVYRAMMALAKQKLKPDA